MTAATEREVRAWTTGMEDEIVPLPVPQGHAVYFETGYGVVEAYVDEHGELMICNGEYPFSILVKPDSDSSITVSVDGWNEEPQPGEVCCKCGAPATVIHVWKPNGRRVGYCHGPGDYEARIRCEAASLEAL